MANSNEVIASATKDKRKIDVPIVHVAVTAILYEDGLLLAKFNARRNRACEFKSACIFAL